MITTNQIKEAVVKKLHDAGFRVFDENIKEPDLDAGALVQVTVAPLTTFIHGGGVYEDKSILIDCSWVNAAVPTNADMYDALEQMNRMLNPAFACGTRNLKPSNVRYNILDGIAHFMFDLEFTDIIIPGEEEPEMDTLIIKNNMED